ncbi:MAG TPA: hypothetical protein VFZ23_02670 [Pyrinomonadaceae bacterium]
MEVEDRVKESRRYPEAQLAQTPDNASIPPATLNRIAIVVIAALTGFLLGYVPMWFTSTGYQVDLDAMVKRLRPSVLQNDLATATINARRGEFEQARQQTSSFFTDLRAEFESGETAFAAEQREGMQSILEQRDNIITLLARNDPASADRLTDLYFSYLQVKNSAEPEKK